jgi:hypothetical protein
MAPSRGLRRVLALVVVTVALVAMIATPASAGPRLTCVANGHVGLTDNGDGTWTWDVQGVGPCLNFGTGPYFVSFSGSGTSTGLGLCTGLVVQDLNIDVNLNILNIRNGNVTSTTENWFAPITTFPIATPFFINDGQSGAGAIATRVGANCPPGGFSVATFAFHTTT